ncbi:MAG: GtrA family protein [Blautia sp.]
MKKIKELFWRCYGNSILRYIFFGGLTTLVNLVSFFVFREILLLPLQVANIISIVLAVLFAYVVNSKYVFQDNCHGLSEHFLPFCRFVGARAVTMVVEVGGVWLLVQVLHLPDMLGKFLTQFVVLALNYIFSRFFVFRKKL